MIDPTTLDRALQGLRDLVEADGGGIVVTGIGADSVELALVLESAECRECVMPASFLEQLALDMLGPVVTGLRAVRIIDPRE